MTQRDGGFRADAGEGRAYARNYRVRTAILSPEEETYPRLSSLHMHIKPPVPCRGG
jgi:hypothetical protein